MTFVKNVTGLLTFVIFGLSLPRHHHQYIGYEVTIIQIQRPLVGYRPKGPCLPDWITPGRHRDRGRCDPDGRNLTLTPFARSKCAHRAHRAHKKGAITLITTTMAKVYGITGKAQGKYGNAVFRIRFGQQIMAEYNPVVKNPRTTAQVESRAKLKLLSQLSASMGPVIAIPREGAVSPRNFFTRYSYELVSYNNMTASIDLSRVQLTHSTLNLPNLTSSVSGTTYTIGLSVASPNLTAVAYAFFVVQPDGSLRLLDNKVVSTGPTFETTLSSSAGKIIVYAYGIEPLSEMARVKYGQMNVASATVLASLIANRTLTVQDVALTETLYKDLTA